MRSLFGAACGRGARERRAVATVASVGAVMALALTSTANATPNPNAPNKAGMESCKNGGWVAQGFPTRVSV